MFVTGFYDLGVHEKRRTGRAEWVARTKWLRSQPNEVLAVRTQGHEPLVESPPHWRTLDVEPPDFSDAGRVRTALASSTHGWDPLKDTPSYFCLMRHRVQWMVAAARATEDAERVLTWIDMGIPHQADDNLLDVLLRPPRPGAIRLCEISYVPKQARLDARQYYSRHWWPVGGGLWAARAPEIEWLAARIEQEWQVSLDLGLPATDEMLIGRIALLNPERFDVYYGDHPTLIQNWAGVRGSHRLVAEMALRALEDGDHRAAHRRYRALAKGTASLALGGPAVGAEK